MKITIVTVTYNCVNTIEKTIISVLQQKYQNIEYLIIDNCSNDGTLDIVNGYAQKYKDIIYVVSEPDTGIYNAMNKGIAFARGDYINFLNAGDEYIDSNVLNTVIDYIEDKNAVYYGYVQEVTDTRTFIADFSKEKGTLKEKLYTGKMPCHQAIFAPAVLLKKRYFQEEYKIRADYEWIVHSLQNEVCFIYVPVLVCRFEMGVSGDLKNYYYMQQETQKVLREYECYMKGNDKEDWRALSTKHFVMYQLLAKWVKMKQRGIAFESYFKRYQISNIAIYGMSDLGQLLFYELRDTKIGISYCIDRKLDEFDGIIIEKEIRRKFEGVDAIVITALSDYEKICKELEENGNNCRKILLLDVICEMEDKVSV